MGHFVSPTRETLADKRFCLIKVIEYEIIDTRPQPILRIKKMEIVKTAKVRNP